jgi:hypothetical protein
VETSNHFWDSVVRLAKELTVRYAEK